MSKKFRCGRLLLTRDGRIKKLDLGNGGGTRTCDWPSDTMTLDDVHNELLTIFSYSKTKILKSFSFKKVFFSSG
jgi:hypothetical protein